MFTNLCSLHGWEQGAWAEQEETGEGAAEEDAWVMHPPPPPTDILRLRKLSSHC